MKKDKRKKDMLTIFFFLANPIYQINNIIQNVDYDLIEFKCK